MGLVLSALNQVSRQFVLAPAYIMENGTTAEGNIDIKHNQITCTYPHL